MRQSRDNSLRKSSGAPEGYQYTGLRLFVDHILTKLQYVYMQKGFSS